MMGVDDRRPADPSGQRGPALGARALRRPQCLRATRANGWWWASGSCRRPATSSSGGSGSRTSTASRRDYYIRQLHDWKGSAHVDTLRLPGALTYARMCGATLARAHARSGDWIAIAAYLGKGDVFDERHRRLLGAYADQNERDYEALVRAVRGRKDRGPHRPVGSRRTLGRRSGPGDRHRIDRRPESGPGRGGRPWSPSCRGRRYTDGTSRVRPLTRRPTARATEQPVDPPRRDSAAEALAP